jgi:hypothetical protein
MTSKSTMSNEELIAKFRDWRSWWYKKPAEELEEEVSYISKLAEFMAPVPLSEVTKAVLQDFYLDQQMQDFYLHQQMHSQPRGSRPVIMHTHIVIDAFFGDLRRQKKKR